MAVPWRERPRDLATWSAKPAAMELVAHATLSLPQPEPVIVGRERPRGIAGVRIRFANSGRRAEIVRLATRALKALRASSVPLRPRLRAAGGLDHARREPLPATIDGRHTEVRDDVEGRRYSLIIFAGCSLQPPPHRPMWSTFESAVSGHDSFPTSQRTSWLSVRATSRPRNQ